MFPHSNNSSDATKLLQWAFKDLNLMTIFFTNLKQFVEGWVEFKDDSTTSTDRRNHDLEHEIQGRLDFLTSMYSNDITPDHCSKSSPVFYLRF